MKKLRFNGKGFAHTDGVHRCHGGMVVKAGDTVEVDDDRAAKMLADFPESYELVKSLTERAKRALGKKTGGTDGETTDAK